MSVLAAAYAAVARARRRSYARHPDRQRRLRQPVISVGNIAVGGSGKTPAVAHIARLLIAAGEQPAILSRGYRRREPTEGALVVSDGAHVRADLRRAGDEPLMLARTVPGAVVVVGADRHVSGVVAERRLHCSVHVLDDGFQHVQLWRDVDIVLLAPEDLQGRVLPDGRLREGVSALRRANAIVVNTSGEVDVQAVVERTGVTAVFRASTGLRGPASGQAPGLADPVLAVAGIARPRRFFDLLASSGWRVAGQVVFPDHHWFTRADLDRMVRAAAEAGAAGIVTTEKDVVRLLPFRPFPVPIVAVPLDMTIEPAAPDPGSATGIGTTRFPDWLAAQIAAARAASPEQRA
jgi:tetraacyldisaccharide 4'-kinase